MIGKLHTQKGSSYSQPFYSSFVKMVDDTGNSRSFQKHASIRSIKNEYESKSVLFTYQGC